MTTRKRLFVNSLTGKTGGAAAFADNPPAPRIPDIANYGGIGRANIFPPPGRGTVVMVDALNLLEGDEVTLYWHDPAQPVESRPVPASLNGPMQFDVPADILRRFPAFPPEAPFTGDNTTVNVWYTLYRPFPAETFTSDTTTVTVDWLVPGDPDPDPTTPYVNENLSPFTLPSPVPNGKDLSLGIPRWKHAARGDRLSASWGTTQFAAATIDDTLGESGPAIGVTIPWSVIDNAGDNVVTTYYVLDAVSNHSLWAPSVKADVETGNRLSAPVITGLNDYDELDADALGGQPARVDVRYANPQANDSITLTWTGRTKEGIPLPELKLDYTLPNPPPAKHTFDIFYPQVQALIGGEARTFYTVAASGSAVRPSLSATALVTGSSLSLPAPTVEEAEDGTLDPEGTATVIVRTDYPFMRPSDRVTLLWQGTTADGALVTEQQDKVASEASGNGITFNIPKAKLVAIAGGSVQVAYTILASANVAVPSDTLTLTVKALGSNLLLPAPGVDGAVGNTLDAVNIGATLTVRVPPNAAFLPGDVVDIAWFGTPGDGTYVGNQAKPADVAGVTFELSRTVLIANIGSSVKVQYAFVRPGQDARLSDLRELSVVDSGLLPTPAVDEQAGGQLDPFALLREFTVRVPSDADLVATDSVTATVKGLASSESFTSAPAAGAKGMTFALPATSLLAHLGQAAQVFYTRTRASTATASDLLSVNITDIANGDARLPKPAITQASNNALDLNSFNGNATVTVAPWPLIATGQRVWLRCKGTNQSGTPTTSVLYTASAVNANEAIHGLSVVLPRSSFLDTLKDATELDVECLVTLNRSSNEVNAKAFPVRTYPITSVPSVPEFAIPSVVEAVGNVLQPINAKEGATIRVPANVQLSATDRVSATWSDGSAGGTFTSLPAAGEAAGMLIDIPARTIGLTVGKSVTVSYAVVRSGKTYLSPDYILRVSAFAESDLPKPVISQASGGVLDLATFVGNATVKILPWHLIASEQRVWLRYHGIDRQGNAVTSVLYAGNASVNASQVTQGLSEPLADTFLTTLKDTTTLTVEFLVTFDRTAEEANAEPFPPGIYTVASVPAFSIDTSALSLAENATATRTASGGRIPHSYTSGTPANASVDIATGKVTAFKVGNTVITVKDSSVPPASVSYTVTITAALSIVTSTLSLPVNATATRTATGGSKPYTYTSGTPAIARVDVATGTVTALEAGKTTITVKDGSVPQASESYAVQVTPPAVVIDPAPVSLNAGLVRYTDAVPTTPPAGTFVVRVPTGGTPPFTYSHTGEAVYNLGNGTFIARSNGESVVTVRDANGSTASYSITVAYVYYMKALGNFTFDQADAEARRQGGWLPGEKQIKEMRAAYNGFPTGATGNRPFWTTDMQGPNRVVVNLDSDAWAAWPPPFWGKYADTVALFYT